MIDFIVRAAKAVKAGAEWVIEKVSGVFGSALPLVTRVGTATGVAVVAVGLAVAPIATIALGAVVVGGLYAAYKAAQDLDEAAPGARPATEAVVDAVAPLAEAVGLVFSVGSLVLLAVLMPEVALFAAAVAAFAALSTTRTGTEAAYDEYVAGHAGVM